jgi:hypothetical protein
MENMETSDETSIPEPTSSFKSGLTTTKTLPFLILCAILIFMEQFKMSLLYSQYSVLQEQKRQSEEIPFQSSAAHIERLTNANMSDITSLPLTKLNISMARRVYHIGDGQAMGQTNNQLVSIIHALDRAFDEQGELAWDGSNCTAIVAVSGWAKRILQRFVFE